MELEEGRREIASKFGKAVRSVSAQMRLRDELGDVFMPRARCGRCIDGQMCPHWQAN